MRAGEGPPGGGRTRSTGHARSEIPAAAGRALQGVLAARAGRARGGAPSAHRRGAIGRAGEGLQAHSAARRSGGGGGTADPEGRERNEEEIMGNGVGVYRQACSGIPLAVWFVDRDQRLWNSMMHGTQRFRQVRAASCVIPYVLCGGLYYLRC